MSTPWARPAPVLVTVMTKPAVSPAVIGSASATLVISSTAQLTVIVVAAPLLPVPPLEEPKVAVLFSVRVGQSADSWSRSRAR